MDDSAKLRLTLVEINYANEFIVGSDSGVADRYWWRQVLSLYRNI